jgi:hypothetical protein
MTSHRADPVRSKVLRDKPGPVARHVGPAQLGTTNPSSQLVPGYGRVAHLAIYTLLSKMSSILFSSSFSRNRSVRLAYQPPVSNTFLSEQTSQTNRLYI